MTFRMYILFMSLTTVLAWLGWLLVLWNMDPTEVGVGGLTMFYITLLLGLVGTLTLIGVTYRTLVLGRRDVVSREVRISFRHAVFLSGMAVAALALSAQGFLHWWVFVGLLALISIVEYIFLIREEAHRF